KSGIHVNHNRRVTYINNAVYINEDVLERDDAEIGNTQRTGRHASTRQVDGAKTRLCCKQGMVTVGCAHDLQRLLSSHYLAPPRYWRPHYTIRKLFSFTTFVYIQYCLEVNKQTPRFLTPRSL